MDDAAKPEMARIEIGTRPSRALITRIRNSYQLALSRSPTAEDSALWSMIGAKQAGIHDALISGSEEALIDLLSDPQSTNLYYGVDNLAKDVMAMFIGDSWKDGCEYLKSQIDDLLVSVGDVTFFNPEGGALYPHKTSPYAKSIEDSILALDLRFGGNLSFPNPFAGEFGIATSKGVASYRAIHAVYQAILARRHATTTCLEIGGGMGRTAYFGHLLGLQYTIVDLPMTVVGQALFLAAVFGDDAIWLIGDTTPRGSRIALLPPSELETVGHVDVVLNVDSLTEMGEKTATDYLTWMSENCETFLSINHEANHFTVRNLCLSLYPSSLRSRNPYALRTGYVEELFSFNNHALAAANAELAFATEAIAASSHELAAVHASRSWKITRPFRRLSTLLR